MEYITLSFFILSVIFYVFGLKDRHNAQKVLNETLDFNREYDLLKDKLFIDLHNAIKKLQNKCDQARQYFREAGYPKSDNDNSHVAEWCRDYDKSYNLTNSLLKSNDPK